jgi:hypothetical protein
MSGDWVDPTAESRERRRAAVGLLGMALLAAIVVLVAVTFLNPNGSSNGSGSGPRPLDSLTNSATPHSSGSATKGGRSSSARPTASPKRTATPTHTKPPRTSCPTSSPCTLSTDGGDMIGAINAYRKQNGVAPIQGTVSRAAQQCAIQNGDSSACPSSYYWEPVSAWDGKQVVQKIIGNGGGAYLLDPSISSFAVGWSFDPGSKQYDCAVVAHYR